MSIKLTISAFICKPLVKYCHSFRIINGQHSMRLASHASRSNTSIANIIMRYANRRNTNVNIVATAEQLLMHDTLNYINYVWIPEDNEGTKLSTARLIVINGHISSEIPMDHILFHTQILTPVTTKWTERIRMVGVLSFLFL